MIAKVPLLDLVNVEPDAIAPAPEKVYVPDAAETLTSPGLTSDPMVTVPPSVFEKVTTSPSVKTEAVEAFNQFSVLLFQAPLEVKFQVKLAEF